MADLLARASVQRVHTALVAAGIEPRIVVLDLSASTAIQASAGLGITVGQIASSLIFRLPDDKPVLVITSGAHRVDEEHLAGQLGVSHLARADADYVKRWSGFSIGGVAPVGWPTTNDVTITMDDALFAYDEIWAAAGHPHTVFPATPDALQRATGARVLSVRP